MWFLFSGILWGYDFYILETPRRCHHQGTIPGGFLQQACFCSHRTFGRTCLSLGCQPQPACVAWAELTRAQLMLITWVRHPWAGHSLHPCPWWALSSPSSFWLCSVHFFPPFKAFSLLPPSWKCSLCYCWESHLRTKSKIWKTLCAGRCLSPCHLWKWQVQTILNGIP